MFDFDGTLADSFPWAAGVANQVADRYGFNRIEENDYELLRGYDITKIMKHLEVPLWKLPTVVGHIQTLMAQDIREIALFEGIESLLQRLSNHGIILAIVSSNTEGNIRQVLGDETSSLIQYYECGVGIFGKSAKLKNVLRRSGVLPGDAVYIGDEIRDIQAARSINVACGGVSWGYNRVEALKEHSPWVVFDHPDDIFEQIAGILSCDSSG